MNKSQRSQLLSAVNAWCLEADRSLDFFMDQRRFLENPNEELIIGFECEEQKECEIKLVRMVENLHKILAYQQKVPSEVGTRNQIPLSSGFLDQTKVFDDL
jgi:hypothetical protein